MGVEPTLHVGDPVDAAWGALPKETRIRPASDVASDGDADSGAAGDPDVDADSDAAADPERVVVRLRDDGDLGDDAASELRGGASGPSGDSASGPSDGGAANADLAVGDDAVALDRLASVRDRYPDATMLAYSVRDLPDAAIDASRLGVEYVSGRRLAADGETLADRLAERSDEKGAPESDAEEESVLEPFIRIVSDRATDLDEKLDALLELGRDRLGLSIGYASHVEDDRLELRQYSDGTGMLDAFFENNPDADRSIPLELTYCQQTVRGDDVVAFTDPEAAGLGDDPAYEQFGFGSYVGGSVVVDDQVFGSLCFLDPERRDRPFAESERLFVELLADWLGRALEREIAREERKAAIERFEETLERVDDAFFALDEEWRFTYVNERAATLLERDAEELLGADVWEEFPAALGEAYERYYRRAMETQKPVSFEDHYEPLDLWVEVTAYPSADGLSVFFADASERKRRERILERLLGTVERIQRADDREAVADGLIEAADEVLGHEISGVRLYDPETERLRLVATSDGLGERFADRGPRPAGEGVTGTVYERGEPWVCDDVDALGDDRDYHGMRSFATVPLGEHGAFVVGAVEPNAFDESDVSVLELLATNAVAAMDAADRRRRLRTYEDALKNVDDMVCVLDGDGAVTYATAPFLAWVDADDLDDVAGESLDALVDEADASRVADAVAALTDAATEAGGAPEPTRTVDLTAHRDGERRPRHGELRLSRLSDHGAGVVVSLSDTTDLRRTRTELSAERDRFRRLFDRIPDPVMEVVLEPEKTVIDGANPAFETQFGVDEATLRGRSIDALDIHDDRLGDREERGGVGAADLDSLVRERGFATEEIRRQTVDGPREFLFRGFSYETEGSRRAFGIYTDITDRKRRERYVRIVNRILRHNLRNELNVVFGFAGEIAERTDDDRIRDYARRIEATGKRLTGVAEGAATLRRVVEKGYATDTEPVDVGAVVEEVVTRHATDRPDAQITADVPAGIAVRGDDRLSIAIDHLVENAVEHGGDAPRVTVTAERDPDAGVVAVRVADDGPGIPTAVQEVITGAREVTQLQHNTGVGLWIAAWVVEAYGGEIRFAAGLDGGGTTVALVLPAAESGGSGFDGGAER